MIITTHCYLFRDGTTLDAGDVVPPNKTGDNSGNANNGDQMWDKLVKKYPNILLVLSGHDPCDDVILTQTAGDNGNTVTQILSDPQGVDKAQGATGMVTMLYFSADGKTMTVRNYSTVRNKYYMGTSQMTVDMPGFAGAPADTTAETSADTPAGTSAEPAETSAEEPSASAAETSGGESGGNDGGCRSAALLPAALPALAGVAFLKRTGRRGKKRD